LLHHVTENQKRNIGDVEGCFEGIDPLSLNQCLSTVDDSKNKQCDVEGCDNWIASNRKCVKHGGITVYKSKICAVPGCQKKSLVHNMGLKHSGIVRKHKTCDVEGCVNGVQVAKSARSIVE
jgi:hypothetical protein